MYRINIKEKLMNYIKDIKEYKPVNPQESQDKKIILDYIEKFPHNIL